MSLKRKKRVLAIDDEPSMTEWLKILLEHAGYEVRTALIGTRGEELFKSWHPDSVITDMMLPDIDGIELVRKFKQIDPEAEVIVITGQGNIPRSVEAVKAGAFDFLEKPVDAERLLDKLEKAIKQKALIDENEQLKARLQDRYKFQNVIGKSKKMQELFELIESVAASEANILIQGENGTGKELIANAIHYNSKRSKGPFIKINCAAIPKDLIESELFGYKKGAFTGATLDKEGLFEMAEGGSLLLDEIGEMPPYLQTKLLRVLQERAVLVAKGSEIAVADLPESIREESTTSTDFVIPPHRTLAEIEKMAILQTLQRTNWNKQEAAQILGLYRPTLYSKMKKHDIRDAGKSARSAASSSSSSTPATT